MMADLQVGAASTGFGERLRALRMRAGYDSQASLARAIGYNQQTVHRHERGLKYPTPASIKRYAAALKVTPAYLQWGEGDEELRIPLAVRRYLAREQVSEEVRARLIRMPWDLLLDGDPGEEHVAEMRYLLDRNLRRRAASRDAQTELPLGSRAVPHAGTGAPGGA